MTDQTPLKLIRQSPRRRPTRNAATELPIARVSVDTGLAHLDRLFDYLVDESDGVDAQPGVRVRVPFAGRTFDGFVIARVSESEHAKVFLSKVVSPEIVLKPDIVQLARQVADRYVGSLADVLRSAVPPRHAATESKILPEPTTLDLETSSASTSWTDFPDYRKFLEAFENPQAPRMVWSAVPGVDPMMQIAELANEVLARDLGVLILLPDQASVKRLNETFFAMKMKNVPTVLTAEDGPSKRYASFLALSRGRSRLCIGTRSAAFAPIQDLGLIIIWDDVDESFEEPHAPGWHAREVAILRSHHQQVALAIGGWSVSVESASLAKSNWAKALLPDKEVVRKAAPKVSTIGDGATYDRMPSNAWKSIKNSLMAGPVLVLVPRRGHTPALRCSGCRNAARCECGGRLELFSTHGVASCNWCGRAYPNWVCPWCQETRFRASVIGNERTANEIGRAFPGVVVRTSTGETRIERVDNEPAIIVSTPGAEPWCAGGYAGGVILDGWAFFDRPVLRAAEDAATRWFQVGALLRPGAPLFLGTENSHPLAQAISRWDALGLSERELGEREELSLPPVSRIAVLQGEMSTLRNAISAVEIPSAQISGPRLIDESRGEVVIRVPKSSAAELTTVLRTLIATSSASKSAPMRIRVDPVTL
jgi:primosomal protein N' (replication factor Y)